MCNMLKFSVAAAVLTATAFSFSPTSAKSVVGRSNKETLAPLSATGDFYNCRRHWRHYGYYGSGTCSSCGTYAGSARYGYSGRGG